MNKARLISCLLLCACGVANAQIQLRAPSPNDRAQSVGQPTLFWSVAGPNLLSNGSFEDGTNGWILPTRTWRIGPRASAYDGTNMLMVTTGMVARVITLPRTTSAIMWTFGVRSDFFSSNFTAEVQTPEGEVLKRQDFWRQGHESQNDNPRLWRGAVDLSTFAGTTVRLALNFKSFSTESSVDDWRVEVFPENVQFDVYMTEPRSAQMSRIARTQGGSLAVTNLWPNAGYQWRVDTIANGQTNTGPVWLFFTRPPGRPEELQFARIPDVICPGRELSLNLFLHDTNGLALSPSASTLSLVAAADNVPPTALITEVNASTNAEIEVANVSNNLLNLSGWRVRLLSPNNFDGQFVWLPTNAFLAPGEMFTIRRQDYGNSAWPHLGIGLTTWRDTNTAAGVVLLDTRSNIVDCVFVDRSPKTNIGWGSLRGRVTPIDWRSLVLEDAEHGLTYQRIGHSDSNTREDWIAAAASFGGVNTGLTIPFSPGFGRAPAFFGGKTNMVKEIPTLVTSVRFPIPLSNVWIQASQPMPVTAEVIGSIGGLSSIFQVGDFGHCMSLLAEEGVAENAGRVTMTVDLGAPAESDLDVNLTLSATSDASGPANVRVPAGASQASFDIQLHDNDTLEGPRSFTITATAPDYSETETRMWIRDDEKPNLTLTVPNLVHEGEPAELVITSSLAPVVPIRLQITSPAPISGARDLLAGTNKLVLYVGGQDDFLQGDGRLTVTVEALDWEPAIAEFDYIDKTIGQLLMEMPQQIVEGGVQKMSISMGAAPASPRLFKLTSSRPDLLVLPEETTIYPGVLQTQIQFHSLPADGPDRVEEVQIIASADGLESVTNIIKVLIEEIDSGQIESVSTDLGDATLRIRFTTRPNWKYSRGQALTLQGSWYQSNESLIGDGGIKEFVIPAWGIVGEYPNFFRIFREPAPN
jgi:hypothetical protein